MNVPGQTVVVASGAGAPDVLTLLQAAGYAGQATSLASNDLDELIGQSGSAILILGLDLGLEDQRERILHLLAEAGSNGAQAMATVALSSGEDAARALERARIEVVERLALACEFRDDDTNEHAQRVGRTAAAIAREVGMPADEVDVIRRAAPLHDIGKIGIADSILLKPGRLRPDEEEIMKTHTLIGEQILGGSESQLLRTAQEIAVSHHERWDGRGYPMGIAGTDIPLAGRMTAVADVFDALSFSRPYKDAWPLDAVLAEMRLSAGRQLDPELVAILDGLDHDALLGPVGADDRAGTPA